jgi:hypothetical protein
MSEFSRLGSEQDAAKGGRRLPSALQTAWALVILLFSGTLLWLSLTAEPPVNKAAPAAPKMATPQPETPAKAAEATKEDAAKSPAEPAPMAPPAKDKFAGLTPTPPAAPDPKLMADSKYGPLPAIGPDGRKPWQVYAHHFGDPANRPRIAIIVSELGLSPLVTTLAIEKLPVAAALAFSSYGENTGVWAEKARKAGHETLALVPMEPQTYPQDDPGPRGLMTGLDPDENIDRLHWTMTRFTGYVGILNDMGSKFTASENDMKAVIEDMSKRGLMLVDARSSRFTVAAKLARTAHIPSAINDRFIDNDLTAAEIDRNLRELEATARTTGAAVGVGHAYPVTVQRIEAWAKGLEARGFVLAPITALADRQTLN